MTDRIIKPADPDDDKPYNAADPRQVGKRTKKAKRIAEDRAAEFEGLLQLASFRLFIWGLICERCQVFQTPFNPNGSMMTHNIGRQSIGLELFTEIERIDPKLIPTMMTEYADSVRD